MSDRLGMLGQAQDEIMIAGSLEIERADAHVHHGGGAHAVCAANIVEAQQQIRRPIRFEERSIMPDGCVVATVVSVDHRLMWVLRGMQRPFHQRIHAQPVARPQTQDVAVLRTEALRPIMQADRYV